MKDLPPFFTIEEAEDFGFSRQTLALLAREGNVERIARGVYAQPGKGNVAEREMVILTKRGTDCVVALESALRVHGMTTAAPHALWIAMRRGARKPAVDFPVEIVRVDDASYEDGIETRLFSGIDVRVYSPSKTVADLFKFRGKVGLDLAIDALKEGLSKKMFSVDELLFHAKKNRVQNVMMPYIECCIR